MSTLRSWSSFDATRADDEAPDRIRLATGAVAVALVVALVVGWPRERATLAGPERSDPELARPLLASMIGSKRCELLARPDFADLETPVQTFYETRNWKLAWTTRRGVSSQAVDVVALLSGAGRQGLAPADYDAGAWNGHLGAAQSAPLEVRAQFDIALTVAAMRFARDLHSGRVDPEAVGPDLAFPREPLDLAAFAAIFGASTNPSETLMSLEPPHLAYKRLLVALARYRAMAERVGELTVATRETLEPGSEYADAPRLASLLRLLGDLPPQAGTGPEPARYEGALVDAVKRFQQRHGLEPDGKIGAATFRALNTPLRERVRQIEITLERWRWVPREVDRPQLVVNIPEYRLTGVDPEGRPAVSMRVVVGEAGSSPTPFVSGKLEHVVFRPHWNVPRSILTEEILPELDDEYLARHDMEIVDASGQSVPLSDDALTALRERKLRLRQRPGPKNSLGPVKFQFPNEEAIYLHGTPAQSLFQRARRDFSHGCIRVEDPETLAAWILRDQPGWTRSRIRHALAGSETQSVELTRPTPIVVAYNTAVVTEDGEVQFFDDVYGLDEALDTALSKARSTPQQTARNHQSDADGDRPASRISAGKQSSDRQTAPLLSGL